MNDRPERPTLDDQPGAPTFRRAVADPAHSGVGLMRHPRIAIIGDTRLHHGELTDAGAIAVELASGWPADVGFRSVANHGEAWEELDALFGAAGITTWLTIREPERQGESNGHSASILMGDMLNIDELFNHDLVIVASRDVALRRFLADLPVHTYPGVRMLSLVHFREGVIAEEDLADLTRFDVIVGGEADFAEIVPVPDGRQRDCAIEAMVPVIEGTNVRAVVSWGKHGAFRCVTRDKPMLTIPPHHAPHTGSDGPWATFVGAVAMGMALRQGWDEIGREATRRFAIRSQALRSERV